MKFARGLIVGLFLAGVLATPAFAVIIRLTALSEVIAESPIIVVATVDSIDKDRPAMLLTVDRTLKGKPSFTKMPVLLKGDAGAVKRDETAQLLKRVAPKLPVVAFISVRDKEYSAFLYTNGTWLSLTGTLVENEVRWSFAHLEPYLRRTYSGTTKEMTELVTDVIAKKRKAPAPDKKGKPGLGPEVEEKKTSSTRSEDVSIAVVPTVLVGGPLAMLAMLFPTVFAGWQRWLVLISTAGTSSTLYTLQWWYATDLAGSWAGSPVTLWTATTLLNALGLCWAWQRHVQRVQRGEAPLRPSWVEVAVLLGLSLLGVGLLGGLWWFNQSPFTAEWLAVTSFILAVWLGAAYGCWKRLRHPRLTPALASETVILTGLLLSAIALGTVLSQAGAAMETDKVTLAWSWRVPQKASISSSPLVVADKVYVAAAFNEFHFKGGALYCLDAATGQQLWSFDDGKKMKMVHSSPTVADGRLYIGEGYHEDAQCKIYCLDAATGKKLWDVTTGSHTESTPVVADGLVYCGAGDDGLYCVDAKSGEVRWRFHGYHIDAPPVVAGGRVFAGAGVGDAIQRTAALCLDAKTGAKLWEIATPAPVWGRPAVFADRVYFATGHGRLNAPDDLGKKGGAVYCARIADGKELWQKRMPHDVLAPLEVDADCLYLGCRDERLYSLAREDGSVLWKRPMGSPVMAGVALVREEERTAWVYAISTGGRLACYGAGTGEMVWARDLGDRLASADASSTPAVVAREDARRIYVALTLQSSGVVGELRCYEERVPQEQKSAE